MESGSEVPLHVLGAPYETWMRVIEFATKLGQNVRYFRDCLVSVLLSKNILVSMISHMRGDPQQKCLIESHLSLLFLQIVGCTVVHGDRQCGNS